MLRTAFYRWVDSCLSTFICYQIIQQRCINCCLQRAGYYMHTDASGIYAHLRMCGLTCKCVSVFMCVQFVSSLGLFPSCTAESTSAYRQTCILTYSQHLSPPSFSLSFGLLCPAIKHQLTYPWWASIQQQLAVMQRSSSTG